MNEPDVNEMISNAFSIGKNKTLDIGVRLKEFNNSNGNLTFQLDKLDNQMFNNFIKYIDNMNIYFKINIEYEE